VFINHKGIRKAEKLGDLGTATDVAGVGHQLGHSRIKITYDVYDHAIPGSSKSEVGDLDNLQLETFA
jgi:hypothetical protein